MFNMYKLYTVDENYWYKHDEGIIDVTSSPRELTLSNVVSNSLQILISWFLFVTLNSVSNLTTFGFVMKYFGKHITLELDIYTSVHLKR